MITAFQSSRLIVAMGLMTARNQLTEVRRSVCLNEPQVKRINDLVDGIDLLFAETIPNAAAVGEKA